MYFLFTAQQSNTKEDEMGGHVAGNTVLAGKTLPDELI
jgi:hypothetical protein